MFLDTVVLDIFFPSPHTPRSASPRSIVDELTPSNVRVDLNAVDLDPVIRKLATDLFDESSRRFLFETRPSRSFFPLLLSLFFFFFFLFYITAVTLVAVDVYRGFRLLA